MVKTSAMVGTVEKYGKAVKSDLKILHYSIQYANQNSYILNLLMAEFIYGM